MLVGLSLLVIIGVVAIGLFVRDEKVDPRTGCPVGHAVASAHTIILIDETDHLSPDELRYAHDLVMTEYLWLPIGGRLTVRNIISDPNAAEDIVVCRIDDGSKVLGISKNQRKARQEFDRIAGARLDELFAMLEAAPAEEFSPILEFISAALDRPDFGSALEKRRLVILSDMAQHSDLMSQYGQRAGPVLDRDVREFLRREMSRVAVRIHYVSRRKLSGLQGDRHRAFWTSYLRGMHADVAIGHDFLIGEEPGTEIYHDDS